MKLAAGSLLLGRPVLDRHDSGTARIEMERREIEMALRVGKGLLG